ncbi:MAG: YdiL family protein, partial [Bifidobacteriaceae bacterium]|nr:YdiL family protein [Bifidobacteriaceae bacterium]
MSAAGISPAELIARRHGLGLSQAQLGAALARPVKQTMVSLWESGTRPIPDGLDTELQALEARSQRAYEAAYDEALRSGSPARIEVWADDAALWAARPEATGLPAVAYQAAAARAAQDARR